MRGCQTIYPNDGYINSDKKFACWMTAKQSKGERRKMTEQEQFKHVKSTVSDWLEEETHWENSYLTFEDVKVIEKALEKQIPAKVKITPTDYVANYNCPICDKPLEFNPWNEKKYCDCGQKLDWH